ncbi:hypothetical protein [Hydrogenophaga sp. BPS33]|nr:hypothetical protein [Hydrogenophaga sp. BPS33]
MIDAVLFILELLAMGVLLYASDRVDARKLKSLPGLFAYRKDPKDK